MRLVGGRELHGNLPWIGKVGRGKGKEGRLVNLVELVFFSFILGALSVTAILPHTIASFDPRHVDKAAAPHASYYQAYLPLVPGR